MIKINDFNTQHISCEYADSVIKMERHFKMGNRYLSYILNERNFRDDIVLCPPSKLIKVIESFNLRFPDIDYDAEDWRYFRNYMIRQYERVRKGILHLVLNSLNLSVCPYCNRQYIFGTDNNRKVGAQFDHFYSKSKYPYLALSFYNLIPCCPTCNKAKGEECIEGIQRVICEMEEIVYQGISREEILLMKRLLTEMKNNLLNSKDFKGVDMDTIIEKTCPSARGSF
mgnify:CR=1 FL=1